MRLSKRSGSRAVSFQAFGVQVELSLGNPELEGLVREILPPGWAPCDVTKSSGRFGLRRTGPDSYEVTVHGEPWLQHATLDVALGMLDAQIRVFIAATAPDWIFVHAGVVACGGRAVAIPGESFSGKTTLVASLVRAGATYYSDEYAVLDADGRVHPYPRRLSIRSPDSGHAVELSAGELGGTVADKSADLALVVVTRYRPGATWRPRELSSGRGLVALLTNTLPAQERSAESLRVLGQAVAGAKVLEGERGEADAIACELLAELDVDAGEADRATPNHR